MNPNDNRPIWRTIQSKIKLTDELSFLDELVHNLWWSCSKEAADVFEALDPQLWNDCDQNPVILLQRISFERIHEVIKDIALMDRIKKLLQSFEKYMSQGYDTSKPSVAYFSMEYGFTHLLKIYSGGLGILAGDYLKEASDSRIDMVGIGLLYRYGYFTQAISPDGSQVAQYEPQNFSELPIKQVFNENGEPLILAVPYPGRDVYANIWLVKVGRVHLYLLDTDMDMNSEFDRPITHQLYGGDWENRIKQEYLLGIGGILLLKKLGIKKDIYHCNEGHPAFLNLQRLVDLIEENGLTFVQALEVVRASSLYTVHTPVPSGHDYFDEGLLGKYLGGYPARLGMDWQSFMGLGRENNGNNGKFSMSVFALNTCLYANGVSKLHGRVSRDMFKGLWPGYSSQELHVGYVTNGVHMPTWTAKQMKILYEETFGKDFYKYLSNRENWNKIQDVPDEKLWEVRLKLKKRFLMYVGEQLKKGCITNLISPSQVFSIVEKFNPNALLVGFARRFATYKRAHLLFSDLDRLSRLVNNETHPIHFIFAGKAHPADGAGQGLIKRIIEISRRPEFSGKIIFLENYDMRLAKRLISGVDIWLNTPTRPQEASGTSGQKALMNGVLNFSVLDGWWYEGYRQDAGWCLSEEQTYENPAYQDELDASAIYYMFEHQILPVYYAHNSKGFSPEWIQMIKNSIGYIAPEFTTKRMIDDYINKYYTPLGERTTMMKADNYGMAKELAKWKNDTAINGDNVVVESISVKDKNGNIMTESPLYMEGDPISINIVLDRKNMVSDLGIDFVLTKYDVKQDKHQFVLSKEIPLVKKEGSKLYFDLDFNMSLSGFFHYSFRIFPKHKLMAHRMDFPFVRWI